MEANSLFYGDNLEWLQRKTHFSDDSIDLIYLDPPFNSNADYNIIFSEKEGAKSQAQLKAFDDTWKWEKESSHQALLELTVSSPSISEFIRWLSRHGDTKSTGTAAYLSMMAIRLIELHRILKSTGTIYLHCDPTASHYLKMIMDVIFGTKNFRNEIVWCYSGGGIPTQDFPRKHDVLFRYTKGKQWTYHHEYHPYNELTTQRMQYIHKGIMVDTTRGTPVTDWWTDLKRPTGPMNKERLGYPTQKPEALLERIIKASSNEGDTVLDPFCGCGTSISVASRLNRKWMGIDVTYLAIDLIEKRLADSFGSDIKKTYKVHGSPFDTASAQALFDKDNKDKHAFELWALSLVGARSRIKDSGVDGIIGFIDDSGEPRRIVVQVKGGANLTPSIIRDLDGTVKNESAAMGLLISLHTPTKGIYEYANHAGDYKSTQRDKPFQMLQVRTIDDLLHGITFDLPMWKRASM